MATWRDRVDPPPEPAPAAVRGAWPEGCIRPEDRDGYWLTPFFQERLARELEACRALEELQAVEARIQRRYAPNAEWRKFNHRTLEPLREIAKARREELRGIHFLRERAP